MRTDTQSKTNPEISLNGRASCSTTEPKETMKMVRKTLHPLQIAAGDKENLVGAGRMPSMVNDNDPKSAVNVKISKVSPKKDKKKVTKGQDKKIITVEDLTSEASPSENYWEVLAETRRKALEEALVENQQLHEKLNKLQEENLKYQDLLQEAQQVIDTLNEIIAEINSEDSVASDEVIRRP